MTASVRRARSPRGRRSRMGLVVHRDALRHPHRRMAPDGTLLGFLAPAVAVAGDMFIATHDAPDDQSVVSRVAMANAMDPASSVALVCRPERQPSRLVADTRRWWSRHRLRFAVVCGRRATPFARHSGRRCSTFALAAVIAATVTVWGMSWSFDTESWAAACGTRGRNHARTRGARQWCRAVLADDLVPGRSPCLSSCGRRASTIRVTSRSSSLATPGRATPPSTSCGISCFLSPIIQTSDFVVLSSTLSTLSAR